MSEAPEGIWAFYAPEIAESENGATIVAHETVQHGAVPYIRADMAAARIADLERQVCNADQLATDRLRTIIDLTAKLAEREAQVERLLAMQTDREVDHERQLAEARDKALEEAAKLIDKRADDYHTEHGFYDYSTDVTEYPGNGSESMEEWEELANAVRNMKGPTP